jgi:hypothetical protein
MDPRLFVLFSGNLTHDDDCLASLVSLKKKRRRWIPFKPPFDSHSADQLRSEQLPPWFLHAQWHERMQRSRECAV